MKWKSYIAEFTAVVPNDVLQLWIEMIRREESKISKLLMTKMFENDMKHCGEANEIL